MKKLTKMILAFLAIAVCGGTLLCQQAKADPMITGTIGFIGTVNLNTPTVETATAVTGWHFVGNTGSPLVAIADGSFAPALGTFATFSTPWTFTAGATPLWSVLAGGFTFDLFAGSTVVHTGSGTTASVTVMGTGIVHGVGYADTVGTWSFTTQNPPSGGGPTAVFSFSSSTGTPTVPDGGATVGLLGLALTAIETLRRRMNASKA